MPKAYIDEHISDFDLQQALAEVSPQRRAYALHYRNERDQRLSLAAYKLLQHALSQEFGISDELPQFEYDPSGKPRLQGHPDIHFSLSHCREAVACAVDSRAVGIDIETLDHYSHEVAARVMSEKEMHQILTSPHPAEAFTRLWTMKESLYKLTGDDGGGDIAHMLTDGLPVTFETTVHPSYVCTVCRFSR